MLEEVNHELFTLCEEAVTDIFHPLLETLRAEYDKTPKAEWSAKEDAIISGTLARFGNAEKFAVASYVIEHREDVSDDAVNPLPDEEELKELFRFLWHSALEAK